jgi:hypothetical protein
MTSTNDLLDTATRHNYDGDMDTHVATTSDQRLLRVHAAATALGVSTSYLRSLEREGKIPKIGRNTGGQRLYSSDDLSVIRQALYVPVTSEKS